MVSRDLTCNETMPPLDDGDNMIELRKMRPTPTVAAFSHYQQPTNLIQTLNEINQSTSRSILIGDDISHGTVGLSHTTTVRDVVTRQIRNSKLKNESNRQLGFHKFGLLGTSSANSVHGQNPTISNHIEHQMLNNTMTNHNRYHDASIPNGRMIGVGHRKIANNSIIHTNADEIQQQQQQQQSAFVAKAPVNTTYLLTNNQATAFHQAMVNSLPAGSQIVRITTDGSNLATSGDGIIHQSIVGGQHGSQANNHWQYHAPESPRKSSRTAATTTVIAAEPIHGVYSAVAQSSSSCSTTIYEAVMPPDFADHDEPNGIEAPTTSSQSQRGPSTPHSSPRPSILRGNNLRRLADKDRPSSASSIGDAYGNGTSRLQNCASQEGEDSNGGDDTPRKRFRKQQFSEIAPDKLMMEVSADPREQHCASTDPSLGWKSAPQQELNNQHQQHLSTQFANSISPALSVGGTTTNAGRPPKKRGRPKIKNNHHHQQYKAATTMGMDRHNTNNSTTTAVLPSVGTTNMATIHQQISGQPPIPRMMVEVDSILNANSLVKKRSYKKRTPEIDPQTGEVVKKVRKKGSGRKSKREMELAAQQERESAILAGMGMGFHHQQNMMSNNNNNNAQQQLFYLPQNYANSGGSNDQSQQIAVEEQNVINTLCRLRRDSEQQQQQRKEAAASSSSALQPPSTIAHHQSFPSTSGKHPSKDNNKVTKRKVKQAALQQQQAAAAAIPRPALPLLTGLTELVELLPLLRRCERDVLSSADSAHLTEAFGELRSLLNPDDDPTKPTTSGSTFTAQSAYRRKTAATKNATNQQSSGEQQHPIDKICRHASCPVFDSYEELNSALNAIRLLPHACAYFENSQRLLHSIRSNLYGHLLYKQLSTEFKTADNKQIDCKVSQEEAAALVPLSGLKLEKRTTDEGDNGNSKKLLSRLFKEFVATKHLKKGEEHKEGNDNNNGLDEQFLLQLDVAQTLDSLLDRVQRHQQPSHSSGLNVKFPASKVAEKRLNEEEHFPERNSPVHFDVHNRLPKAFLELISTAQGRKVRKRRRQSSSSDEEEDERDDEEEEASLEFERNLMRNNGHNTNGEESIVKDRQYHSMLERIFNIRDQAQQDLIQIEQFSAGLSQLFNPLLTSTRPSSSSSATRVEQLSSREEQRKRSPHKISSQFVFRPPPELIKELFKNISDFDETPKSQEKEIDTDAEAAKQPGCSNGEKNGKRKAEEETNGNSANGGQEKLVMEDLDEMLANSEHISASALAQLKWKYPDIFRPIETKKTSILSKLSNEKNSGKGPAVEEHSTSNEHPHDFVPFRPVLKHVLPPDSAPERQEEFLKERIHELREICTTTVNLVQSRFSLARECVDCMREIVDGPRGGNIVTTNKASAGPDKANCSRKQSQQTTRNVPATRLQGRGSREGSAVPAKRAAHRRALNNIRTGSSSRTGSVDMMDAG